MEFTRRSLLKSLIGLAVFPFVQPLKEKAEVWKGVTLPNGQEAGYFRLYSGEMPTSPEVLDNDNNILHEGVFVKINNYRKTGLQ